MSFRITSCTECCWLAWNGRNEFCKLDPDNRMVENNITIQEWCDLEDDEQ